MCGSLTLTANPTLLSNPPKSCHDTRRKRRKGIQRLAPMLIFISHPLSSLLTDWKALSAQQLAKSWPQSSQLNGIVNSHKSVDSCGPEWLSPLFVRQVGASVETEPPGKELALWTGRLAVASSCSTDCSKSIPPTNSAFPQFQIVLELTLNHHCFHFISFPFHLQAPQPLTWHNSIVLIERTAPT